MPSQEFENAVAQSKNIPTKPSNEDLLSLYSLYKQATEGDVSGEKPGGFDFKGVAKYNAWEAQKGKDKGVAEKEYIAVVRRLSQG